MTVNTKLQISKLHFENCHSQNLVTIVKLPPQQLRLRHSSSPNDYGDVPSNTTFQLRMIDPLLPVNND